MAQSSDNPIYAEDSVVGAGKAQRGGNWPKPGDEGFVHPDGTPQSARQLIENRQAALNREAAGSQVHGAPAQGGVQGAPVPVMDETDMAKARREHTEYVREGLADLGTDTSDDTATTSGKHEATAPAPAKSADTKSAS
jgi:hypothetical protein